ncbi:hypothetical protein GCK32_001935 [Trichostrongylus colubriformis]|uniref:G-protein coupled receptors family 1 profile domain-containing protein n=1 Tax=Trichostrongylus colubriformis TaxID=6319 RepID=A0AAN8FFJ1_TRICO
MKLIVLIILVGFVLSDSSYTEADSDSSYSEDDSDSSYTDDDSVNLIWTEIPGPTPKSILKKTGSTIKKPGRGVQFAKVCTYGGFKLQRVKELPNLSLRLFLLTLKKEFNSTDCTLSYQVENNDGETPFSVFRIDHQNETSNSSVYGIQKLLMDTNDSFAVVKAAGESIYVTVLEAVLLWLICTIGIASNLLAFFVLSRHRAFKSSFGQLAACSAFGNAGVLIIIVLWAVPWTIWEIPNGLQYMNLRMGQLSLSFYEATTHCILFISVNRFTAITFPTYYNMIFTTKTTYGIFAFIAVIDVLYTATFFIGGCNYSFHHATSAWLFGKTPCGLFLADVDLYYNGSLVCIFTLIDFVTIVQLRIRGMKMVTDASSREAATRNKREFMFFIQTAITSSTYVILYFTSYLITFMVRTKFLMFLCTTFVWAATHCAGGLILVLLNAEVRRYLRPTQKSTPVFTLTNFNIRGCVAVENSRCVEANEDCFRADRKYALSRGCDCSDVDALSLRPRSLSFNRSVQRLSK